MKSPKTQLLDGEKLIREGGGGPASFLGSKGGRMYLTNKRIFHESLMGGKVTFSINLSDIAECRKVRYSNIICLIPLMSAICVFKKDGTSIKFNASDKDGWVVAINQATK